MDTAPLYERLERLTHLLRTEERTAGLTDGLQPVHLQVLAYLARCNRYSNSPAGVADYLGLTKGTVSQTLNLLEARGWIQKNPSLIDKRVVHVQLTAEGRQRLQQLWPPAPVQAALSALSSAQQAQLTTALTDLLIALQQAQNGLSFGVCHSCQHFQREPSPRDSAPQFRCGLTQEPLTVADSQLICREHLAA